MNKDDLIKEMGRVAKAFQAPDQVLELDIQKVINSMRVDAKLPAAHIETLDAALHAPEKLTWTRMPGVPEKDDGFTPNQEQIEFFKELIRVVSDGAVWEVQRTGQKYKIDKQNKTFTMIKETETDHDNWHSKNKKILSLLGWKMIDTLTSTRSFSATSGDWTFTVFDFSIEAQENPNTPGTNFPPGTRGQDSVAMLKNSGTFVRLGNVIGRALIKHALPEFGTGKTTVAGTMMEGENK